MEDGVKTGLKVSVLRDETPLHAGLRIMSREDRTKQQTPQHGIGDKSLSYTITQGA